MEHRGVVVGVVGDKQIYGDGRGRGIYRVH